MHTLTAVELHNRFLKGELSAYSIVRCFLERIEKYDEGVGAFLEVFAKKAILQAKLLDEKKMSGQSLGKLAGIPIAFKDNLHIKGQRLTCASKFLENYIAPFDATVTELIEQADGIILGRTNMDEFAMGASTETSAFKKTYNPWDLKCSPGGSSGGAAAAVAACFAPIALGSDTGGSIRQPSAFCGVIGFKPSYGRVSRYGLIPLASSFDHIGPIANNVEDISLMMEVIGRHCKKDPTSLKIPPHEGMKNSVSIFKGKKIGVPWHFLEGLDAENKQIFIDSIKVLTDYGAKIIDIDFSILKYSMALYCILAFAEASTNLARFDGGFYGPGNDYALSFEKLCSHSEKYGYEVKRRILLGMYALFFNDTHHYYDKALKVRTLIVEHFKKIFTECFLIVMPTTPTAAFDAETVLNPLEMAFADIYTIGANLAGLPAVSVPSGLTANNKPLGFQIMGPIKEDASVLCAAYAFETAIKGKISFSQMAQFL